ncbi:MAG: hypothetical protein JO218_12945 [Burkholderiales bacterium]|nr:hypothetical protein [Burkholderiales bacterium]
MNNAPKLSITVRLGNAIVALFVTCIMVAGVDALAGYYVQQGAASQMAASTHVKMQKA